MTSEKTDADTQMVGTISGSALVSMHLDVVAVQRDTLRAVLHERGQAPSGQAVGYWAALALTTIAAYSTSTFKPLLGVPAATISACFLLGALFSTVMALVSATRWFRSRKFSTVDEIVEEVFRRSKKLEATNAR